MSFVIGIDKGTTATKAVVFDALTGQTIASAHRSTRSRSRDGMKRIWTSPLQVSRSASARRLQKRVYPQMM